MVVINLSCYSEPPRIINSSLESGTVFSVSEDSDVTFSCEATGIPLPNITFVTSSNRVLFAVEVQLITNSIIGILSLTNVVDSDSGNYTCVADNGVQESASASFELVVQGTFTSILNKSFHIVDDS